MQVIRGLYNLKEHHRNTVVTIGNFDGVHRGHQTVLAAVVKKATGVFCSFNSACAPDTFVREVAGIER